jgi:hypothetical protein
LSYQLPAWVWPVALLGVCIITVWRGRDEERLAAGALLANWALDLVLVNRTHVYDLHMEILATDLALLVLYLWLALRSRRYWPLFAASFQLLVIFTHLGRAVDPAVRTWAYLTAEVLWSYLVLFAIAFGAWTTPGLDRR